MAAAQLGWLDEADMVRETWRKLRHRYSDLKHLSVSEDENASGIVRLACAMSNHVSDAEMLFSECYLPGSSELFTALSGVSETFSWHARQREMVSNIVHHGFGCYVDDINGLRLKMGSHDKVNLTWAMLSIGSMVEADSSSMFQDPSERVIARSEPDRTSSLSGGGGLAKRANQSHILDIVRSVVPSRSYSTIKGE
ncbi:unnamed protein product [Linum trigynum]|uniref:Uncharacterized protein n=1 Tax=Linum trigynum TaxID=586398 RepID=A0AAV2DCW3_9ROSI